MLDGGNHSTNLPLCPQQPWLIDYVKGDKSNHKTAESQSWGKSAIEERYVMANVCVCILWGLVGCVNVGRILTISSRAFFSPSRNIDKWTLFEYLWAARVR